jgi:hemerythrin-like domain-containing protein
MPTQTTLHLRREHNEIRRLLKILGRYLVEAERAESADPREVSGFVDFLGEAVFQKHEEKEEEVLLPELARMGLHFRDGVLSQVRAEHRQGRDLYAQMRKSLRNVSEISKSFLPSIREWVRFSRDHMLREERLLFPYIDANLPEDLDTIVVRQFEKTDRDYMEMTDSPLLAARRDGFEARYGVTPAAHP